MAEPRVSVIIPTFNRARLVPDAVDSVFAQGRDDVQVIVVDDGSTDHTARRLGQRYGERIDLIRQQNQGQAVARNVGLVRARGEIVSFLDSDDVWLPGKLARELELFDADPSLDALVSDASFFRHGELEVESRFRWAGLDLPAGVERPLVTDCPPVWVENSICATCCLSVRRRALDRLGLPVFDTTFTSHEDWDLELRLYHLCKVALWPEVTAHVRRFEDGTRERRRGTFRSRAQIQYTLLGRLRNLPPLSPEVTERVGRRRRQLARRIARQSTGLSQRWQCLPLAWQEAREGGVAQALRVLALAAGPVPPPPGAS